jgi:omega-amidase
MDKNWLLGIVQNQVSVDKKTNIEKVREMIAETASKGAKVVALPEMFNCPYASDFFPKFAEEYPSGETLEMLAEVARTNQIYLFGGSIPEKEGDSIYNSCFVFGPDGKFIARHRKLHLFDVELSEGLTFKESDTLGRGNDITVVDTEYGKIGVEICYDIRFPELARELTLRGAVMMIVPAAFNMITGPVHWELTVRMRALDNQFYVAGIAPARDSQASYVAYGHSVVAGPWGNILQSMDEKEGIMIVEIDPKRIEKARNELPLLKHRRTDIYK